MPRNVVNMSKFQTIELGSSNDLARRHGRLQIHHQRVAVRRLPKNVGTANVPSRARHVINHNRHSNSFFVDTVGSAARLYRRLLQDREERQYGLDLEDRELFAHSLTAGRKSATQPRINAVCLRSAPMRSSFAERLKRLYLQKREECKDANKSPIPYSGP